MARYDETQFKTTHNSYSGNIQGSRGSLVEQLDDGIRCLELDIHDNQYSEVGDYRVGHLTPGFEVSKGDGTPESNPTDLRLRSWLQLFAARSKANPHHTSITLVLDIKGNFTDSDNDKGGDLEDLNRELEKELPQLFTRDDRDRLGEWPEVDDLNGGFLCVLSGDGATRKAYRWSFGIEPVLAVNAKGKIVLAYRSSASGDLNAWTGEVMDSPAGVRWLRKTTLGPSNPPLFNPAIAINDDGWIVAVYRFKPSFDFPRTLLASRVGHLEEDGRVTWFSSSTAPFDAGVIPSLSIDGDDVREIHTTADGPRRQVSGTLNRHTGKVEWHGPADTTAPLFGRDTAPLGTHTLRVSLDATGAIHCGLDGGNEPVRFRQVAFVERQSGEPPEAFKDALFFAADAKNKAAIKVAHDQHLVCRAWMFNGQEDETNPADPVENMPATDNPRAAFYEAYTKDAEDA